MKAQKGFLEHLHCFWTRIWYCHSHGHEYSVDILNDEGQLDGWKCAHCDKKLYWNSKASHS